MVASLDAELLPTFLSVVEHGRIAAAARALHLSQPAVTARIRRLETSLGTTLLERSVRGVAPTPAGLRLAAHAREIQRMLDEAAADVGESVAAQPLAIAASTTIAAQVLPAALAAYRQKHPHVEIKLRIGNTEDVLEAVRSGRFPLGLVEGLRRAAAVRLEPWVDDELLLAVRRDAPASWRPRDAVGLRDMPLLWREPGSGTRAVVARALRAAGARSKPQAGDLVLGSNEAITSGIAAGLGVGFLSRWSLGPHVTSGRIRVVPGFPLTVRRTFHWALPSGGLSGTASHFLQHATQNPPVPG